MNLIRLCQYSVPGDRLHYNLNVHGFTIKTCIFCKNGQWNDSGIQLSTEMIWEHITIYICWQLCKCVYLLCLSYYLYIVYVFMCRLIYYVLCKNWHNSRLFNANIVFVSGVSRHWFSWSGGLNCVAETVGHYGFL